MLSLGVLCKKGDAWAVADHPSLGGGLNGEFHQKANMTVRTGYRADYRSFSDMSALTQFEQRGFASVLANFEPETTLIAEVTLAANLDDGQVMLDPVVVVLNARYLGHDGETYGRGMGMGSGSAHQHHVGPAPVARPGRHSRLVTAPQASSRAAQSISDRTGVHGQVASAPPSAPCRCSLLLRQPARR